MEEEFVEFSTFNSLDEVKQYCEKASCEDLQVMLEILDIHSDAEYIQFIKSILK